MEYLARLMSIIFVLSIKWLKIDIDRLQCFILFLWYYLWRFWYSLQLMNVLIYKNYSLLIFWILRPYPIHELIYLLPIKVIHVFWANLTPYFLSLCLLQLFICILFIWKLVFLIKVQLRLQYWFHMVIQSHSIFSWLLLFEIHWLWLP
jgi:hypothetical protein